MKVAVIVVNFNDTEDTVKYVSTIAKYDVIDRIVVVDNKSTEANTMDRLKNLEDSKVSVIEAEKNGGYDYGNNFGIKYLESKNEKYDYYIISNSDIEVSRDAIKHCLSVIDYDKKIGIIAPRMFNKDNEPIRRSSWKRRTFWLDCIHSTRLLEVLFYDVLRKGEYSREEYEIEKLEVEAIAGAFFIIRADLFKQMGYLDENIFLFYEEDILAHKVKEYGYKTISLNSEKFIHYESSTIGKTHTYYKKMKQMFISKMYYHKKYNKINKVQAAIFHILYFFRKIELLIEIPLRKLVTKPK